MNLYKFFKTLLIGAKVISLSLLAIAAGLTLIMTIVAIGGGTLAEPTSVFDFIVTYKYAFGTVCLLGACYAVGRFFDSF